MPSHGMVGRITTLRLQHSPTSGHTPFSIANCDDCRMLQPFRATGAPSPSGRLALLPLQYQEGDREMKRKIKVERFSLTTSKPFDEVIAGVNAAIGHPDMAEFARSTHE